MKNLKALLLAFVLTGTAQAQPDPSARGLQIAEEMTRRDNDFRSYRVDMEMTLRDRQGQSSSRRIRAAVLEVEADGDKHRLSFDTPPDLRGTVFLSFAHAARNDDQWLYLPSMKRTRRIASESKAGSFMGSEFAFEDMTALELEKFTYKHLADEAIDSRPAFKIERVPRYEGSGYTRQVVWVDAERYVPLKIQFYDRRDGLQKTLTYAGYGLYENRFWKPAGMSMENHQNGKSTLIKFEAYQFGVKVAMQDFDPLRLGNDH